MTATAAVWFVLGFATGVGVVSAAVVAVAFGVWINTRG
jgi:hypothetical protein